MGGLVNMQFVANGGDGRPVNPAYRFAHFDIMPSDDGKATGWVSWSRSGELDNSNMHSHGMKSFDPAQTTLVVFLPEVGGGDGFDY